MKFLRFNLYLALGLACAGVWVGFAGPLHAAADAVSMLRLALAGLCLLGLALRMHVTLRVVVGITAVLGLLTTVPLWVGGAKAGELTIYSKNIWFQNDTLDALAADIQASGAEVVTLQEVSARNERLLMLLAVDYPHQHVCRFSRWSGVAVLSTYPINAEACSTRRAVAAAQITKDGQDIWVGSVHLPWPFPYANAAASKSAQALLETLEGPVVIGGDFNIFPWADSVQQMQRSTRAKLARPLRPTFYLKGVPLLLDHVHAPGGGQVTYRPLLGSDHYGVLADVSLAAGA